MAHRGGWQHWVPEHLGGLEVAGGWAAWGLGITSWREGKACFPHGAHVAPGTGQSSTERRW